MEENRAPAPGPEPQLPPAAQTGAQQGPERPHTSGSKSCAKDTAGLPPGAPRASTEHTPQSKGEPLSCPARGPAQRRRPCGRSVCRGATGEKRGGGGHCLRPPEPAAEAAPPPTGVAPTGCRGPAVALRSTWPTRSLRETDGPRKHVLPSHRDRRDPCGGLDRCASAYLLQDFTTEPGSNTNTLKHSSIDWTGIGILEEIKVVSGSRRIIFSIPNKEFPQESKTHYNLTIQPSLNTQPKRYRGSRPAPSSV